MSVLGEEVRKAQIILNNVRVISEVVMYLGDSNFNANEILLPKQEIKVN